METLDYQFRTRNWDSGKVTSMSECLKFYGLTSKLLIMDAGGVVRKSVLPVLGNSKSVRDDSAA